MFSAQTIKKSIWSKRHRTDGPAFESTNGIQGWWENGKLMYAYDPNEDE